MSTTSETSREGFEDSFDEAEAALLEEELEAPATDPERPQANPHDGIGVPHTPPVAVPHDGIGVPHTPPVAVPHDGIGVPHTPPTE